MDTLLRSLTVDIPFLGGTTIFLSAILFWQTLFTGRRLSTLEKQRDTLHRQKSALATEVDRLQAELRGTYLWSAH